jgi:ADP-heptose:LPS heptosyltransferase
MRSFKQIIFFISDSLILFLFIFYRAKKTGTLLVRIDALGDFTLWISQLEYYKTKYGENDHSIIVNKSNEAIARELKFFNQVFSVDIVKYQQNGVYRFLFNLRIRKSNYLNAINLSMNRIRSTNDSIIRISGSKFRFYPKIQNLKYSILDTFFLNICYTNEIIIPEEISSELEANIFFSKKITGVSKNLKYVIPKFRVGDKYQLQSLEYYIVFPGAGWSGRIWNPEKFAAVVNELTLKTNLIPIFCGGSGDAIVVERIICNLSSNSYINLVNKTNVVELFEVIRSAKFLIGNETSGVHIASALSVHSFCILGGGHFGRFLPYPQGYSEYNPMCFYDILDCFYCNWNCCKSFAQGTSVPCIDNVKVSSVVNHILFFLSKKSL